METQVLDLQKEELTESTALQIREQLKSSPDVQRIYRSIDYKDQLQLIELGKEPAMEISQFADRILADMRVNRIEDSGALLTQLGKIMDKFDKNDFSEEKKGFLSRLFSKGDKLIEKIFNKYQTMGGEIDKIYVEITKYQNEMKKSIAAMDELYQENLKYYFELEKYVVAGELVLEELQTNILPALETRVANGEQAASMEIEGVRNAIEAVAQRVDDLEKARMVAILTAPQIRTLQRGNNKLIAKINTAFVTTIPVFKQGIIQAVNAKRQKLVADSMAELDRRTNELLTRNAQNIANQSVEIARLTGTSSIKTETLEQTWDIINRGLQETKQIEDQNKREREESKKRLEALTDKVRNTTGII